MIHLINDLCGYRLLLIRLSAATLALSLPLFSALRRAWQNRVPSSFFSSLYLSLPLSLFPLSCSVARRGMRTEGLQTALLIGLIFQCVHRTWHSFTVRRCISFLSLFHRLSLSDLPLSSLSLSINKRVIIAPVKGMVMRAVVMVIGGGGCVFITDLSYWGKKAVIEPWLRHIRSPLPYATAGRVGTLENWTKMPLWWLKAQSKAKVSDDST